MGYVKAFLILGIFLDIFAAVQCRYKSDYSKSAWYMSLAIWGTVIVIGVK
jgi:hypothetical protein